MSDPTNTLIDQALSDPEPAARREAFLGLLGSADWRSVLAPEVISHQGFASRVGAMLPDLATFHAAAKVISADDEKVQRSLELAGARFGDVLLYALARLMTTALVEPALSHFRTAQGVRRALLQRVLSDADPMWVREPGAAQIIRRQLREVDQDRSELMLRLARAGNLAEFVDVLRKQPPMSLEEWGALGRGAVKDDRLFDIAMASLPRTPSPLGYLLRLEPVPPRVVQRVMAAARGDWVASALESAVLDAVRSPAMLPLAELGVRLGGRSLGIATAWVTSSKVAVDLLQLLSVRLKNGSSKEIVEALRLEYTVPSADRALEQGRRGEEPDPLDAAALVRQLRGRKVRNIVREILKQPRPELVQSVLRPLCSVSAEAAQEVVALCKVNDGDVAARAREARAWGDVFWPFAEDSTQEVDLDSI